MADRKASRFRSGTDLDAARREFRKLVSPHGRTESFPLSCSDGRVLAESVDAMQNSPHYIRAAMDGFAIRADDVVEASAQSPARLILTTGAVGPGQASEVNTGSPLPEGADTVARIEKVDRRDATIHVLESVSEGKDVAPIGEDVEVGQSLYPAGHRLRPSDLGLLKAAGVRRVTVYEPPTVAILPTGEELVDTDPARGESIETNGLMVEQYVDRWGATPFKQETVTDDVDLLGRAIRDAAGEVDIVVTTGGSSVGNRDLVPEVVESCGYLHTHGVEIKPGHPVGFGAVEDTPILLLPGYPVSCIVNAVQFLRPAINWLVNTTPTELPTTRARLETAIEHPEAVRRFIRVRLEPTDEASKPDGEPGSGPAREEQGDYPTAVPVERSGAGVLSSVALADGWIEIPVTVDELPSGTPVDVQDWERHP